MSSLALESDDPARAPTESPDDRRLGEGVFAVLWDGGGGATWWILFWIAVAGTLVFVGAVTYSVDRGVGVWGTNMPVVWAFPIVNFVWWIGLGHAGTFISAFLLLLDQPWRSAVNRLAETMTIFALINALLFPLLHLGRPWFAYWLLPYPATMGVWPNFKSSLTWDIVAIITYLIVSLLFWYLGMIPDLAAVRDRAATRKRRLTYGILALGWAGSGTEWRHRNSALIIMAAIAAPLVFSVHTIVSLDFAVAFVSGWHETIFPPYFVIGAIYSGLALVLVLAVAIRAAYGLQDVITDMHLDRLAKITLVVGLLLMYCYVVEMFSAWYSGDPYERAQYFVHRLRGPFAAIYWTMLAMNFLTPQLFWFARMRRSPVVVATAGLVILVAMWLERFVIIVGSLSRDFLPSSWREYAPSWVDVAILGGSIAFFALFYLLFLRFVPVAAVSELRANRFLASRGEL